MYLRLVYLALLDNRYRNDMTTTDEWVDEISGVKGAYYVQDSLKMYRAQVHWDGRSRWLMTHFSSIAGLDEQTAVPSIEHVRMDSSASSVRTSCRLVLRFFHCSELGRSWQNRYTVQIMALITPPSWFEQKKPSLRIHL